MKPEIDQILGLSAAQLMGAVVPQLPAGYPATSASLLAIMLTLSAQEYDRAADTRAGENAEMRALFRDCAPVVDDEELRDLLLKAAETRDASLKIGALNAENVALRRVLIRLQVFCEEKALRGLEREIWALLRRSAERRLLRIA